MAAEQAKPAAPVAGVSPASGCAPLRGEAQQRAAREAWGWSISRRIVDLDEFMGDAELRRHMRGHGRRAVALGGVVAAGEEGHAAFARQMGLGLGNLAGDEGVGAGGDRGLEVALRAAAAPSYCFNSCLRLFHNDHGPFQHIFQVFGQGLGIGEGDGAGISGGAGMRGVAKWMRAFSVV